MPLTEEPVQSLHFPVADFIDVLAVSDPIGRVNGVIRRNRGVPASRSDRNGLKSPLLSFKMIFVKIGQKQLFFLCMIY